MIEFMQKVGGAGLLIIDRGISPNSAVHRVSFTTGIPKTNLQTLTITGRVSWGRL